MLYQYNFNQCILIKKSINIDRKIILLFFIDETKREREHVNDAVY